ncbi:hypothetical protein E4K65_21675 [Bradyrhizobium niftali]|uniref:Uncharacterized protein n=1 Tax=Bradyrhizobium niftali TaxID=2560055 RepID=A0A4Y9LS19_9BRAD|nr:hypothetical protein E4K65_21675 [Bradyrhizobium niftali]
MGKGALAPCPPSICIRREAWWARGACHRARIRATRWLCLPYELLPRRHFEEPLRRSNPDRLRGKSLDCFAKLAMTKSGAPSLLLRSAHDALRAT